MVSQRAALTNPKSTVWKPQDLIYKGKNKAYSVNGVSSAFEPLFSAKASEDIQRPDHFILQNLNTIGRLKILILVWALSYNTGVSGCKLLTRNDKIDTTNMLTQILWRHKLNISVWNQGVKYHLPSISQNTGGASSLWKMLFWVFCVADSCQYTSAQEKGTTVRAISIQHVLYRGQQVWCTKSNLHFKKKLMLCFLGHLCTVLSPCPTFPQ